jgi:hypothetical protein
MKTIIALGTALLLMGSAFAQEGGNGAGYKHMFEFNADSVLKGALSFDKSKTPGKDADNDTQLDLNLNYAYALPTMPRLQLGGRLNYLKDTNSGGDIENYGLQVGAIWNHTADLQNSLYASLYLGMLWNKEYGSDGGNDEVRVSTIAVGKRFAMDRWGIKHLTYSPEIALQNQNSTTGGDFEYTQSLQFRFLQFSVFF